jgi:ribose 5-phosphate isomerase B
MVETYDLYPYNLTKMAALKVFIASDHGGFKLKQEIYAFLTDLNFFVEDLGPMDTTAVDYPDYAVLVSNKVLENQNSLGILLCGTGIGMSISANKIKGIRAALCSETVSAKFAREHNQANVLCMGARIIGPIMAQEIVKTFLNTQFEGGRHISRVQKIQKLEENH